MLLKNQKCPLTSKEGYLVLTTKYLVLLGPQG